MRVTPITRQELQAFLATQDRYLYEQSVKYTQLYDTIDILGLRDDDGVIRASAVVTYRRWRRFFKRAHIVSGPILDWSDVALVEAFLTGLKAYYRSNPSVLSINFNPILARNYYDDIELTGHNPVADQLDQIVERLGGKHYEEDYYSNSALPIRFAYTKTIEGMTLEEVLKSCDRSTRTRFNTYGTPGLTVRYLKPNEFEEFVQLERHTAQRTGEAPQRPLTLNRRLHELSLDPQSCMLPAAVLNCDDYLQGLDSQERELQATIATLEAKERELAQTGEQLIKKQRGLLKYTRDRLAVIAKRRAHTEEVKAESGNEIVLAASYFRASPNELVYLLSGAYSQYQSYYGVYLIHRYMIEWAIDHGIKRYNFFGISGDFSQSAVDAGVIEFKRQFNGYVEEYVGDYYLPVHPFMSRLLQCDAA